jgi:hypothetical protein
VSGAALAVALSLAGPAVGPALAGDVVVWGENGRNGAVRVKAGAPGREPVLLHRIAPATARRTERHLGQVPASFGASASAFAALVHTSTVTSEDGDSISSQSTNAVVGGPLRGPAGALAGCVPRRGDAGCGEACGGPDALAVDGERIAIAASGGPCDRYEAWRTTIAVDGVAVDAGRPNDLREMALAGRYLAWLQDGDGVLVVHDLEAGAAVLRLAARDAGARGFDELALQPDGTIAFTAYRRRGPAQRLGWAAPGSPGVRLVDRRAAYGDIALSGGRVLYERLLGEFGGELILRPLTGGEERKLAHFPERRRRVGDLDLDGARATWAAQPTRRGYDPPPRGPARIVLRSL